MSDQKKTFRQIRADLEWEGTVLAARFHAWFVFLLYVAAGPACIALSIVADWLALPWAAGLVYFWVYIREDLPSWEASK